MLFSSRYKKNFINKSIKYLWPRAGWKRALKYLSLRVKRLPGSPHSIALGFSLGTAAAMTPFYGAHFLFGIFFAWLLGGSIAASILGNFIGNPWTFPFICLINFKMGSFLVSSHSSGLVGIESITTELSILGQIISSTFIEGNFDTSLDAITDLELIPLILLGSFPVSVLAGLLSYSLAKNVITNYQIKRKNIIQSKLRKNNE